MSEKRLTWSEWSKKHEIPRKALHTSIGFCSLILQKLGTEATDVTPWLELFFIPAFSCDLLRFNWPAFSRLFNKLFGPLMRESELKNWNGLIFYVVGVWVVLKLFPKEIAAMSILLLSWCDTAASTLGRRFGKYTPKIAKNKSLAGSMGAFFCGTFCAYLYWGLLFKSPDSLAARSSIPFPLLCVINGLIGAFAEAMDIWGLDDNLVIPIVSGTLLYLIL
ncbi:phosphatidate cytidylyltransferase Ptp4 [Schizosaccharomyces japonicus yFS275]|uniref:Phosphatidate cytidylyltransferase Ptp4 n=1 Tax=Schizosaccharomyces japonicus (strain yFS275 / FY16936) TaxID=402676 RepID=B6K807_SCHJY|nr:phosphatidate cytidylyltransferase Ptp4 [Schizosaccharomyces japonicus yFS275]EEB09661.1 phosphatidate cytidylyltransferase Ptp4 [Schizosaccharomyces japonicus yFS275]